MDKPESARDEVDLVQLVKVLVHRKWFILIGTLVITFAAIGISLLMPKVYQSQGFFQLSRGVEFDIEELKKMQEQIRDDFQRNEVGNRTIQKDLLLTEVLHDNNWMQKNVSIPDYKKYSSQFTNPSLLRRFIEQYSGNEKNKSELIELKKQVKNRIRTSSDIDQWLEPVYAYSKKDLANLGQIAKDIRNFVVGIQVTGEAFNPESAGLLVSILGDFIEDCMIYGKMTEYIGEQLNQCRSQGRFYDNLVIKDQFKLKQLQAKRDQVKELLTRYPQSSSINNRELVSLELGGHRYLSPITQLVGIESHIADLKENIAHNRRNQQLMDLKVIYYTQAKKLLEKERFGGVLLERCIEFKNTFTTASNYPDDVKQQVMNELEMDIESFQGLKRDMQFVARPSMSDKAVKPKKALIAIIAFILGLIIFVFLAFLSEWWHTNKKKIGTRPDDR